MGNQLQSLNFISSQVTQSHKQLIEKAYHFCGVCESKNTSITETDDLPDYEEDNEEFENEDEQQSDTETHNMGN